jgi:hypothetical protein
MSSTSLFVVARRSLCRRTQTSKWLHVWLVLVQDFPVSVSLIWTQWRAGKMDADTCLSELIRCRDPRSPQSITALELIVRKEKILNLQQDIRSVQGLLSQQQRPFIDHPLIREWMQQYSEHNYGKTSRFKILALVGGSQQGKTSKGVSLFGIERTLKLGCQSLPQGVLPSVAGFDRHRHKAMCFDECRTDQILANREFFQACQFVQSLSQSLCNQHSYDVWAYQTAMIVCSNFLPTTTEAGLSTQDADWMTANVVVVQLAAGQTWFM